MNIISLGAGVQSTAMLIMADRGELLVEKHVDIDGEMINTQELHPIKVDCAIFCDTGWEPKHVYKHLDKLISEVSIPVHIVSKGNIRQDIVNVLEGKKKRFASIPFFIDNPDGSKGIGRRQCTNEYKIQPFNKKSRELLGLKKYQRAKPNSVNKLLGITTDEINRVKPSSDKWSKNVYPFIDMRWNRNNCISYLKSIGWGDTPKSACIGCPFHSNRMWSDMKKNYPEEFADAVELDNMLRKENNRKMKGKEFIHNSLKPLSEAYFSDQDQIDLFDMECEGMCGL
jgi:3'-phosphoadenosine 5'-phosphosulfate sulfotransferase (PAPS reductase)/FAD synthetase